MRRPVVFSYARLRPAVVRLLSAKKPSTTVQNNAAGSTCRSRFTAPVERASATRNTAGKSLRRASRIGTAFSRAIGCSSSFGKPEVRSMARPSSQKAAIIAQIVRTDSLNRTPMLSPATGGAPQLSENARGGVTARAQRAAPDQTGDEQLTKVFRTGGDPHRHTASLVMNVPEDQVGEEQRRRAKAPNFGVSFGMGKDKLIAYARKNYGVELTPDEAATFKQ